MDENFPQVFGQVATRDGDELPRLMVSDGPPPGVPPEVPPQHRFGKASRRIGVAWLMASLVVVALIGLGVVALNERGHLSTTRAELSRQESATRDLRTKLAETSARSRELDSQVADLTGQNGDLTVAVGTCADAVRLGQRFIDAAGRAFNATTQSAFDQAMSVANHLYFQARVAQENCLAKAGSGASSH